MSLFSGGGKGNSDAKTQTTETATNQQSGADNGGISLGSGSSGNSVSIQNVDKDVVQAALASNQKATSDALIATTGTTSQALTANTTLGLESIAGQNAALTTALASNNHTTDSALGLAGGAIQTVASALSSQYDQSAKALSDATQQGNNLNEYLASRLTSTLDKAVPETDAAQAATQQKTLLIGLGIAAAVGIAALTYGRRK